VINVDNLKSQRGKIFHDFLPDLTPLLDVMFMLIVFLILTMNIAQKDFGVNLPTDKKNLLPSSAAQGAINVVIFSQQKQWAIDDEKFANFDQFKKALLIKREELPSGSIKIISDKNAPVESLVDLLIFLKAENIDNSDIVVQ
jgi:biopolymer transport protein ExbD